MYQSGFFHGSCFVQGFWFTLLHEVSPLPLAAFQQKKSAGLPQQPCRSKQDRPMRTSHQDDELRVPFEQRGRVPKTRLVMLAKWVSNRGL